MEQQFQECIVKLGLNYIEHLNIVQQHLSQDQLQHLSQAPIIARFQALQWSSFV